MLHLFIPAPSVYMSYQILKNEVIKARDRISNNAEPVRMRIDFTMKIISFFYLSFLWVFVGAFLFIFVQKYGHPSFYSVTLWYIYYYGVMNLYMPIIQSGLYIKQHQRDINLFKSK